MAAGLEVTAEGSSGTFLKTSSYNLTVSNWSLLSLNSTTMSTSSPSSLWDNLLILTWYKWLQIWGVMPLALCPTATPPLCCSFSHQVWKHPCTSMCKVFLKKKWAPDLFLLPFITFTLIFLNETSPLIRLPPSLYDLTFLNVEKAKPSISKSIASSEYYCSKV